MGQDFPPPPGSWSPGGSDYQHLPPPAAASCDLCGWSPAAFVSLRKQVGLLISRRVESIDANLCRQCGLALYRSMTSRTLVTGWWGIVSVFTNFLYLAQNVKAGQELAKLPPPHTGPTHGDVPLPQPMDPGKPLAGRPGPWVLAVLVTVAVGSVVAAALGTAQRGEAGEITRSGRLAVSDLRMGDCFDDPDLTDTETEIDEVRVLPCSEEHDNEVYAVGVFPAGADAPYPGHEAVLEQAGDACLDRFEPFVGMAYEDSLLDITVITPTQGSWENGDRVYLCAVYDLFGPVEGSLAGVAR